MPNPTSDPLLLPAPPSRPASLISGTMSGGGRPRKGGMGASVSAGVVTSAEVKSAAVNEEEAAARFHEAKAEKERSLLEVRQCVRARCSSARLTPTAGCEGVMCGSRRVFWCIVAFEACARMVLPAFPAPLGCHGR